jgi:hypothetical protein
MEIMKYVDKYILLFTKPTLFFQKVAKEKAYWPIILFVAVLSFIAELFEVVIWTPMILRSGLGSFQMYTTIASYIASLFLTPLFTVLMVFVAAALVHLLISYFKGKGSFFTTWKVVAYTSVISVAYSLLSSVLLLFIDLVNPDSTQSILAPEPVMGVWWFAGIVLSILIALAILVHVIYTQIVGLVLYHKISKGQALIAIVTPFFIVFLFIFILVAFAVGGTIIATGLL